MFLVAVSVSFNIMEEMLANMKERPPVTLRYQRDEHLQVSCKGLAEGNL